MSIIHGIIGSLSSAPTPFFNIYSYASSINEGSTGTAYYEYTNYPSTTLYWSLNSANTENEDFEGNVHPSGSFNISGNGSGSFNYTAIADQLTEGQEYCYLYIGTSPGGSDVYGNYVYINDTSTGPTYSFGSYSTSVNEGESLSIPVNTTNVADGTTLYWVANAGSSDLTATSGSFVINSNTGSFSIAATADLTTEGNEYFVAQVRTGSVSGTVVLETDTLTINDISTTPPPTYSWAIYNTSAGEGFSNQFDVSTTRVSDGTTLYWTIPNTIGIDSSDFTANTGSFSITANAGSFSVEAVSDGFTEGTQNYTVQVRTDSTSGNVVLTSNAVSISDNSTGTISYTSFSTGSGFVNTSTDNSNLNVNENYTIEWWQKVSHSQLSSGTSYCPVSQYDSSLSGYNYIDYVFNFGGNYMVMNGYYASFNFTPSNGTWDHIAISATNGHAKAFINGTKVYDRGDLYQPLTQTTDLYIGKRGSSSSYSFPFPGKVTGFTLSNVAKYSANFDAISTAWPPAADANTVLQFAPKQNSTLGVTTINNSQVYQYNCEIVRDAPA